MSDYTILTLSGFGIPEYSARGLTQTLEPIDASKQLRRTVNGELDDLSYSQFRKYRSTISGNDQEPPAIDGIWPGHMVTVGCMTEISYPVGGTPARPVVYGSERIDDVNGFVFYRPLLDMMVTDFSVDRDEWGAAVSWQMQLEEI